MVKKCIFYVVFSYLVASWGVNGVINPVHYYNAATMDEKEIVPSDEKEFWVLDTGKSKEQVRYLSFEILDAKNRYFDIKVGESDEELIKQNVEVHVGFNTIRISENRSSVYIGKNEIIANNAIINSYVLSEFPKMDLAKTIEIMFSIMFLLSFWEEIRYIRDKYTK